MEVGGKEGFHDVGSIYELKLKWGLFVEGGGIELANECALRVLNLALIIWFRHGEICI